jgi:flagellar biosynthetic protein FliP
VTRRAAAALVLSAAALFFTAAPSFAATPTQSIQSTQSTQSTQALAGSPSGPTSPTGPAAPSKGTADTGSSADSSDGSDSSSDGSDDGTLTVTVPGTNGKPSSTITIILAITALSVAPALLLMMTSFTKIFVVLGLTRNALGLGSTPPTQVLAGLALFLSLFVMGPVLTQVNSQGIQPYLKGDKSQSQAFTDGVQPLKEFMLKQTRGEELALMTKDSGQAKPANRDATPLTTLIPAFVLSELRSAFVMGFMIFIPFLIIDLVVSSSLMSMGMMMLPPVSVSLPFKLLLFVLVDGWGLVVHALVTSYR